MNQEFGISLNTHENSIKQILLKWSTWISSPQFMVIEFKLLYCGMRHALKRTETQKLQIASVILKSVLNPFYLINQREKIQLLKTSPLNFTNFKMLRKKTNNSRHFFFFLQICTFILNWKRVSYRSPIFQFILVETRNEVFLRSYFSNHIH